MTPLCQRRSATDEAAARLERTIGPTGVLLSTDADTLVASTWLAATLHEIETGAEAVGGRILTQTPAAVEPCAVRRIQLRDAAYRVLLRQLEPTWTIEMVERLDRAAPKGATAGERYAAPQMQALNR